MVVYHKLTLYNICMLKSIQNFFIFVFEYILPPRTNFEIVKKLNKEKINALPKAPPVLGEDWIFPIFHYKNKTVKAIIWELKYKENTLPLEHIGKLIFEEIIALISDILIFDNDAKFIIIPIPITDKRRSERGYNQSELITRSIIENDSEHILLYAPQWLKKTKETPRQSHLESKYDRVMNLLDSFEADERVSGSYVIIIDDVATTGSTMLEARKELLNKGVKKVFGFSIAH